METKNCILTVTTLDKKVAKITCSLAAARTLVIAGHLKDGSCGFHYLAHLAKQWNLDLDIQDVTPVAA